MPNAYVQVDAAVTAWRERRHDEALDLFRGAAERGGIGAVVYLADKVVELGDPRLGTMLDDAAGRLGAGWPGEHVRRCRKALDDPAAGRDTKRQLDAERLMGNQFDFVERAIELFRSDRREDATVALRGVAERGGEAAGAWLVERLLDFREPRLTPLLEEMARVRRDIWLGDRAREAAATLTQPR